MEQSLLDISSITQFSAKTDPSMDGPMVFFRLNHLGSVYSDSLTYKKYLRINSDGYL